MQLSWHAARRALMICGAATTLALFEPSASAQTDSFGKANQEYAAGQFKEAITDYEALRENGEYSPSLFYNLGNAYFRTNDFGKAILNYERALALNPTHPEAKANLQIARDEARALELQVSGPERFFHSETANQATVIAAVTFWLTFFCAVYLIFAPRRAMSAIALSILSFVIFALTAAGVYWIEHGNRGIGLAIVTAKDVEARVATADTANRVLTLPPGSEIKIVSERGDWVYATLPNNLKGWIRAKSADLVRL